MNAPTAIVFLGNPGREYELTRHNLGFRVAATWGPSVHAPWQSKFRGQWAPLTWGDRKIYLLRPETYMNLVGESARALGDFYRIPPAEWLAVHDDIDLPLGTVKVQQGGGLGGHNGLRSLKQHLGTDAFGRLRLGIGRPVHGDVASFVLGRFNPDEEITVARQLDEASQALEASLGGR